ncbi:hypothetical protein FRC04_005206 [Tulasnella sp. 424]|nr:hypothetical protein FRC04_005206 [Tulasnella sp. 424]KAG8963332.1 hypothetical protein FRC05_004769 [Tulasnella sp. 425]
MPKVPSQGAPPTPSAASSKSYENTLKRNQACHQVSLVPALSLNTYSSSSSLLAVSQAKTEMVSIIFFSSYPLNAAAAAASGGCAAVQPQTLLVEGRAEGLHYAEAD